MKLHQKALSISFLVTFLLLFSAVPSFAASESPVSSIRATEGISVGDDYQEVLQILQNSNKKWRLDSEVPYLTKLSLRSNYTDEGGYHSRSYLEIGTPHAKNAVLSTTHKITYRSGGMMYSSYLRYLIKTATQNFGEPRYEKVYVSINNTLTPITSPCWKQGQYRLRIVTYKVSDTAYPYVIDIRRDKSIF